MDPENNIVDDEPEPTGSDTPAGDAPAEKTPEQKDAELLDAVSAAIDAETIKPKDEPKTPEGETETPAGETESRERDEHGRFKPKQEAAKPAAAAKPETTGQQPAKPGELQPKQPDPVNDPIPPEIKGKTRERMESLVKTVKDISAERDRVLGERDEILGMIHESRATPEQYGEMLEYLKAVNSGDPQQIRGALMKVQSELAALSRMIGEPVPGVDLLAEHADLKQAVASGEISAQHAQELAAARSMRAVHTQASQHTQNLTQQQQAVAGGRNALNALEAQLQKDDPQYAAKRELLIPMLQPIISKLPPGEWADAFKTAYAKIPATLVQPPANVTRLPANQPSGQPLRAKQPAGAGVKAPSSMLEALNSGIDQVSGR